MRDSARALMLMAFGAAVLGVAVALVCAGLRILPAVLFPVAVVMVAWYRWERPHELRRERAANGQCVACGYDLTANVSGVCPECGGRLA